MIDILLVDDEPFLLSAASRYLRLAKKYTIYTAKDAQESQYVLKSRSIDAVISDHKMPGTCGIELLCWTAKHFPNTVRVLMTGCAMTELIGQRTGDIRIHRFLRKPCEHELLEATIRDALESRRNAEAKRAQTIRAT